MSGVIPYAPLGGGGGGGTLNIPSEQVFDSVVERNIFFTANPEKLIDGALCVVTTNPPSGLYQVYDLESTTWVDTTQVIQGPQGVKGDAGASGVVQEILAGNTNIIIDDSSPDSPQISSFVQAKIDGAEGVPITTISIGSGIVKSVDDGAINLSTIIGDSVPGHALMGDQNGGGVWTKVSPVLSVEDSSSIASSTNSPYIAMNVVPSAHFVEEVNTTAGKVLDIRTDKIERNAPYKTYLSLADLESEVGPITLADLNGVDDDLVRANNVAKILAAMPDRSVMSDTVGELGNISPIPYSCYDIIKKSVTRSYAECYSKLGNDQYLITVPDTDSGADTAERWEKVTVYSDTSAAFSGLSLSQDGVDQDGNMVLKVEMTTISGEKVSDTISIEPTNPVLYSSTVVYGWTNNEDVTAADIEFALSTDQTGDWKTRSENIKNSDLPTASFLAKRTGDEPKYFYIAHLAGVFTPEPYAIDWGVGTDTEIKIGNASYNNGVGRWYMIADDEGKPVANTETQISVKLIQAS